MLAVRAVRAGALDLTVPMLVLACTGASIENDDVCFGACIGAYIGLY